MRLATAYGKCTLTTHLIVKRISHKAMKPASNFQAREAVRLSRESRTSRMGSCKERNGVVADCHFGRR
jgi:hypothetical protein